jgi:DNA polymerase III delta subunit
MEAAVMTQNSPHPLEIWQKSQGKWQEAVNLLEAIPENLSISAKAQEKLAAYRTNYTAISNRIITEEKASTNLENAQKLAMEAAVLAQNPPHSAEVWQQAKAKWQEAISLLEAIPNNTFVSAQAKEKLTVYRNNYAAVSQR